MSKKIGLLGGSFDPVHMGHLNLAFELMEKKQLDEVWFIPAQINPHKTDAPPASIKHRLNMVQLAIRDIPKFILKDFEAKKPGPSYTIDTLREFIAEQAIHPSPHQFFLLMGEDAVPNFARWHLPEEIVELVPLLIGSRTGIWQKDSIQNYDIKIREAILKGFTQTRLIDISSSDIRDRFNQNLYCGHLLSPSVNQYILEHQLYFQ